MAFGHGKNTYFSLGSNGTETTLVNLSTYFNEIGFPETVDTAETSTFGGNGAKTYVVGLTDATISASGMFDPTPDAQISNLLGHETAVSFEYGPQGNATGKVKYSGSLYVTSYEISSPIGDMVSVSVEMQITGAVTRGTFV